MQPTVGVVVPAYHPDPGRLRTYLRAIRETINPDELRVELDLPDAAGGASGDSDAAADAASDSAVPFDLPDDVDCRVVRRRRGKGAAVTAGFEALSTDVYAFADADGATPAPSLADVIATVRGGDADLAAGSRRHPDADVRSHQTFARRFLGDGFAWIARRLLDAELYDYQCGAKAITATAWERARDHLYEPGFAWDIELVAVAAALDYRIVEVPVTWEDQPGSTVSPVGDTLDMGRGLLVARHRARLIRNDRLHRLIDREEGVALIDRPDDRGAVSDGGAAPGRPDDRKGEGAGDSAGDDTAGEGTESR
ncbi:glycosyltransferase [Halobaculum magnesiiphilum]|uniref:Glycosyltransferase n=1 Tax=Halobaculum magnesiiphilum TaxID=1017351 RepID=A0A8T8WA53_9EURY|nr:glycosyltransferase [Halobaculum magnesiiphilum]QZP36715.1 glycosyltransferase [Halobaculum magnesiiphilum]